MGLLVTVDAFLVPPLSLLSPKAVVRPSSIHGRGLFAAARISRNDVVAVKGGHIIDGDTLRILRRRIGSAEIQIGDDLYISPVTDEEREGSMIFSNHSCDPNIGVRGQVVFIAMRDIAVGEELTHDWAMTDDDDTIMVCRCGTSRCRHVVTGKDWQRLELQERYDGYFSSYLVEKLRRSDRP